MAPFYGWGSTASRLEPLQGGSLLFTIQFPDIPGTHFIDLGRMKGWVNFGATQWFWTRNPWTGNPAPEPLGHCSLILKKSSTVFLELLQTFKEYHFEKHLQTAALKFNENVFDSWNRHIIPNLLWKTCFKSILLSACTNTVVIRLTNKRAQIAGSMNNLLWCSKKMRALVQKKKTSSESWPYKLDKGCGLWGINCSLWP